ncbi:MAG TPA: HD domain-containing phosphohydrolase [Thermoanaerobaculia bacterium]|nr:HD domain-containing phosphohydrolase [Thermoanaerobaculia bacterium]
MHPEVEELRPKLKEILYDCAVEIRATKAALYLFDGSNRFELVTEYGFRGTARTSADTNDPLIDRCGRGRTAFYVNGVAVEPRFSELLFESSTDRLLAAPLYTRGKLVGVIDMRDKAGRLPFEKADAERAQEIAERIVALFANTNVFGLRYIALSNMSGEHSAVPKDETAKEPAISGEAPVREKPYATPPPPPPPPAPPKPAAAAPQPAASGEAARVHVPRLATLVLEARTAAGRIVAPPPESLSEADLAAARDALRNMLLIPGAVAVSLSAYGHLGGVQEIVARNTLSEEAKNFLQSKLNLWLAKRGSGGGYARASVSTPFGTSGPAIGANELQKVFTAPIIAGSMRGLYLTVAFSGTPDRGAHELLAALHTHLQLVIEQSMQRGAMSAMRQRVAEKLVEPDFTKYPELKRHSERTSKLAESFARFLALPPAEVENARIVGLVHDAGMRLLEYERLFRKKDLTQEELGFLREHPAVSAAIVEPLLGPELARAVLCHHERPDGRGYPNELHGEEIPALSRLVAICDAYQAMTDPDSYQPAESPTNALATIARAAGTQFDAEMASRFADFVNASMNA